MSKFNFKHFYKVATFMAVVLIFSSSCKDDDPILPEYAGTWAAIENIPTETGFTAMKDIITFTENSFVDLGQIMVGNDKWTDIVSMKGSMSVDGSIMNLTITEIGMTTINMVTKLPTGTIISYREGVAEFNDLLSEMEQPKTFESQYSVSGNKLTLKTDNNNDGDFQDELEITIYTKQ